MVANHHGDKDTSGGWSGEVGEDCLSAKREFRSRLTSRATQGTREAGGKPGSPFLRLPSFGEAKEGNLLSGNPRRF